ncbi:MAG: hypothetical protein R3C14_42280 [Caldilineaceae bacterium]
MIKKLLTILSLCILFLLPTTPAAMAGQAKVDVCHITGAYDFGHGAVPVGHVITVAEPAYPAHRAHGDPEQWVLTNLPDGKTVCRPASAVTVAVEPAGGGSVTGGGLYGWGEIAPLTATANPGWTFSGWTGAATGTENPIAVLVNGPLQLTARFVPQQYTVNAFADPHFGRVTGSGLYNRGETATLTAIPNNQYWFFTDWSGDLTGTDNPASFVVDSNKTIWANFASVCGPPFVLVQVVDMEPPAAGSVSGLGAYLCGETITLQATANDGYVFVGWFIKDVHSTVPEATIVVDRGVIDIIVIFAYVGP